MNDMHHLESDKLFMKIMVGLVASAIIFVLFGL